MDSKNAVAVLYDWVTSIINPPGTLETDKIPIKQSSEDLVLPTDSSPCIIIDYTPSPSTPESGSFTGKTYKNDTSGYAVTGDTYINLENLVAVTDGSLSISLDGEASIDVLNIDLSEAITMTEIAMTLEAVIKKVQGLENISVIYDSLNCVFYFYSNTLGALSACILSTAASGTDLLAEILLNGSTSQPGTEEDVYFQKLYTPYEAEYDIREVFGTGDLLLKLVNSLWKRRSAIYFNKNSVSVSRSNSITAVPALYEDRTIRESVLSIVLSYYGIVEEEMPVFDQTSLQGTATNQDGSSSQDIDLELGGANG